MATVRMILLGIILFGWVPALQAQDGRLKTSEAVLEANVKATGGADAWRRINTIRREGTMEMDTPMGKQQGTFTEHLKLPGYSHRAVVIEAPMGKQETAIIITPEKAWAQTPRGSQALSSPNWVDLMSAKEELTLLQDETVTLQSLETAIEQDLPVYIVTVERNGTTYRRQYDQLTLMLLAAERPSLQGGKEWVYYDDYQEVEGVKVPHAWRTQGVMRVQQGGGAPTEHTVEVHSKLDTLAFNVSVPDTLFEE